MSQRHTTATEPADDVKSGGRFDGAPNPEYTSDLEHMIRKAGRKDLLPWPPRVTRRLARKLWETLEPFINGPEPEDGPGFDLKTAWAELRRVLDLIVAGEPPIHAGDGSRASRLPLWLIVQSDGRVWWQPAIASGEEGPDEDELYHQLVNEVGGSLMTLLWTSDVRPLLIRCPECGSYKLLPQRPRRSGALCGDECRRARKRKRDDATNTERQRRYRGGLEKAGQSWSASVEAEGRTVPRRRP